MLLALKVPPAGELCFGLDCGMLVGNDLDWETDIGTDSEAGGIDVAKYSVASVASSTSSIRTQSTVILRFYNNKKSR